jgi:hypothetical protein
MGIQVAVRSRALLKSQQSTMIVANLPEHIVLQEILPRAYSGLSIDTRRSFGLPPRRIVVSTSTRIALERYVQTRMDDEYDSEDDEDDPPLTISTFTTDVIDAPGIHNGKRYDCVLINMHFWWDQDALELRYRFEKEKGIHAVIAKKKGWNPPSFWSSFGQREGLWGRRRVP